MNNEEFNKNLRLATSGILIKELMKKVKDMEIKHQEELERLKSEYAKEKVEIQNEYGDQVTILNNQKRDFSYIDSKEKYLLMSVDNYLKHVHATCTPKYIFDYVKEQRKINDRNLYVFDLLDVDYSDLPNYDNNIGFTILERDLQKSGLSLSIHIEPQKRDAFEGVARIHEKVYSQMPEKLSYEEWTRLIRNKIYKGLPMDIRSYLNIKNRAEIHNLVNYVSSKCSMLKLSNEIIDNFISEYLADENVSLKDLRSCSKREVFDYKKNPSKVKRMYGIK